MQGEEGEEGEEEEGRERPGGEREGRENRKSKDVVEKAAQRWKNTSTSTYSIVLSSLLSVLFTCM